MDILRESHENNICSNCTTLNDTCSNFSSDQEQPPRLTRKKIKEKRTSKELHPSGYFPVYTPHLASINCFYLDLLRHLALESEIRRSMSKINRTNDHSCSKSCHTHEKFKSEQLCYGKPWKQKLKHFSSKHSKEPCSCFCLACQQKFKCECCKQTVVENETPAPPVIGKHSLKHCKCLLGSCPTLTDIPHVPLTCCHIHCQQLKQPYPSLHHNVCGSSKVSLDIPVREKSGFQKIARSKESSLHLEAYESNSDSDEELNGSCNIINNVPVSNAAKESESVSQNASKLEKKHDLEDVVVPSFLGGTGDEGSKLKVKFPRNTFKRQSTAYFLPLPP